jgi:CRP/FNR family transcriptional regulator
MADDWISAFPQLGRLEEPARRLLADAARQVRVPAGAVLFREGSQCADYMLVLGGSVRVQMVGESGREIVLYRVERGQACVLTTCCLMAGEPYSAEGLAETGVEAVTLPAAAFRELLARSAVFRDFVFSVYGTRIADLLLLVEEVAFGRIDVRLARLLAERAGDGALAATHQELAVELGSAREVVSRQLKEFERRGWVALQRGRIEVRNRTALADLGGTPV